MFYLLSLLLYINGRMSRVKWRSWALFCGCLVSWVMALGSKEIAGTLPFIILIYEWYFFQDLGSDWLRKNIKYFFGLFAVLGLVILIYLGWSPFDKILATYANRDFTMTERVLTQFRVVVLYISLLLYPYPSRLNLLHHITTSNSLLEPITTLLFLLIIVGLIGLAFYIARRQRLISFCILWFIINLVIESSVIGLEMIYEHRLYLPMLGFALIVSCLLFHFLSKRRLWAIVVSAVIILFLCTGTYVRNRVWRDSITLWSDVLSKSPQSHRAHNNLGNALKKQGRTAEAMEHYLQALWIKPDYEIAHNNLGNALDKHGRIAEAMEHYLQALRIKPDYEKAHNNLGNALDKQGRTAEAMEHYLQALRIKPDFVEAHNNLGNALERQGRIAEAMEHYLQALRINPDYEKAHYDLGKALGKQGRTAEAMEHYLQALRIKPDFVEVHNNLGAVLERQGRTAEAMEHYLKALRINPDLEKAHYNLGNALNKQGRTKEAIEHYLQALRINPNFEEAHNNLGSALFRTGNIQGAIAHFREVLRINPDHVYAKKNLKKVLMMQQQNK